MTYQHPRPAGPATAAIAGSLGLVTTILLGTSAIKILVEVPAGLSSLYTTAQVPVLAAAVLCAVGAVLVFLRKLGGAIVLLIAAIATAASVLVQPAFTAAAIHDTDPRASTQSFGEFFAQLFKFANVQSAFVAIALVLAPFLLVFSVLSPTLNWLRGPLVGGYPGR